MILFDKAYKLTLKSIKTLKTEKITLENSLNRILAENVYSDMDMPPFNKSAMDGYACRQCDLKNELKVIEVIKAGKPPFKKIGINECSKIMTGSMIPKGATCVIKVEDVINISKNKIKFNESNTRQNICFKGEDVKKGKCILKKGTKILPCHVAILSSFGYANPYVFKQAKVGIIATGDELVEPNLKPKASQIRSSNGIQLYAQVININCIPKYYGIAKDNEKDLKKYFKKALKENDVVLFTGGVSMGDFDLVPIILTQMGVKLKFKKIYIKPGMPTVFGTLKNKYIFGLPGNPVSTFNLFELLVKPSLYKMMGYDFKQKNITLPLKETIKRKKSDRDNWIPVKINNNGELETLDYHGSAHINSLCNADGLICMKIGQNVLEKGTKVFIRLI